MKVSENAGLNTMVLYHKYCNDGTGAAWAVSKMLPMATFKAMAYGYELPDLTGFNQVYIVDFSLPRDTMEDLHQRLGSDNVILLDHHQTAQQNLQGLPNCVIDMDHSGAILAWQHCFPNQEPPMLLKYVEDRDLWKFQLPHSREVSAYVMCRAFDASFDEWDRMAETIEGNFDNAVEQGRSILREKEILVNSLCKSAVMGMVDGHQVPEVLSSVLQSEIGERLLELYPEAPFAVVHTDDGVTHRYSLRARKGGHNVAETCRKFGGGGHPAAAGFKMPSDRTALSLEAA